MYDGAVRKFYQNNFWVKKVLTKKKMAFSFYFYFFILLLQQLNGFTGYAEFRGPLIWFKKFHT